ncbi:MAG TPA: hypothetical protein VH008_01970 [Pseudonocardia sp.]|nr:hypothetical protein [Pseudonocardia sp.]
MSTTSTGASRRAARRWPLLVLAAPASVSIWAGWVGLGTMAGFGLVHPLPGIADSFTLNSAITLPIGVEAYSAYALGTWLTSRPIPASARRFAAWSSLAALLLGLVGQVIYHLLTTLGYPKAPVAVVVFVACLPVLVLGAGATLHHLLGDDTTSQPADNTGAAPAVSAGDTSRPAVGEASPAAELDIPPAPALPAAETARPVRPGRPARSRKAKRPTPRPTLEGYLAQVRAALDANPEVDPTPAWCRKVTGCGVGTGIKLAAALAAEPDQTSASTRPELSSTTTSTQSGQEAA